MPIDLMAAVEMFSKVRDIAGLLIQERLELLNELLEEVGDIHIRTALQELLEAQYSSHPEKECDRAIGHMKVAANALTKSLKRRSILKRLVGAGKYKRMVTYFHITGCYAIITSLYRIQDNMPMAGKYAFLTMETFEYYASIREPRINSWLFSEFTYNCGTDQMPKVCINNCEELHTLLMRYGMDRPVVYEDTLWELAKQILEAERAKLLNWLDIPQELP